MKNIKLIFNISSNTGGGPHQHQIGALCYQLKLCKYKEFKNYIIQVKKNAIVMAQEFMKRI